MTKAALIVEIEQRGRKGTNVETPHGTRLELSVEVEPLSQDLRAKTVERTRLRQLSVAKGLLGAAGSVAAVVHIARSAAV